MGAPAATKKPEEKRLEKRKRKEVYRQVHQQAVYVRSPHTTSNLLAALRLADAWHLLSTTSAPNTWPPGADGVSCCCAPDRADFRPHSRDRRRHGVLGHAAHASGSIGRYSRAAAYCWRTKRDAVCAPWQRLKSACLPGEESEQALVRSYMQPGGSATARSVRSARLLKDAGRCYAQRGAIFAEL